MSIDLEALSLTDLVRLQTLLGETLTRRFLHPRGLLFTDVVGSTEYFARFGDIAGRQLLVRHLDLLRAAVERFDGRIVDTAGDGAFTCFSSADAALDAAVALARSIELANTRVERAHYVLLRSGVHYAPVLTDDVVVTGEAVHFCARIAASCASGEIRLSEPSFRELTRDHRLRCRALPPAPLKGVPDPQILFSYRWREGASPLTHAWIVETRQLLDLPERDAVTFGRLAHEPGVVGNDIVLRMPDPAQAQAISRWHFELRRAGEGWVVRSLTGQSTVVDGRTVGKGEEAPVRAGSVVRVGSVMTVELRGEAPLGGETQGP